MLYLWAFQEIERALFDGRLSKTLFIIGRNFVHGLVIARVLAVLKPITEGGFTRGPWTTYIYMVSHCLKPLSCKQHVTATEIPVDQLDACYTLCAAQNRENLLLGTFEPEVFKRNWQTFIEEGDGTIIGLYSEGSLRGVLGGLTVCDSQTGSLVGKTVFYYIRKDFLTRSVALVLFGEFQRWAFSKGARWVSLGVPLDRFQAQLDHFLKGDGYRARTVNYQKQL